MQIQKIVKTKKNQKNMYKSILIICSISIYIANATDFDSFFKRFFSDSLFQTEHISYPINGYYLYLCDLNPDGACEKDTVFANAEKDWTYISYGYGTQKNVEYTKSIECPPKLPKGNRCTYIELSQPETDFNLQLYFKEANDSWKLIYMWYFEP